SPSRHHMSFVYATATSSTPSYPLSLHDALPIWILRNPQGGTQPRSGESHRRHPAARRDHGAPARPPRMIHPSSASSTARSPAASDRKSTRLNSSHVKISYAVFCLKKKTKIHTNL